MASDKITHMEGQGGGDPYRDPGPSVARQGGAEGQGEASARAKGKDRHADAAWMSDREGPPG